MSRWFTITTCLFLLLMLPAVVFAGRGSVTGSAELRYAEQSVEENGVKTLDASHFIQQYSFLYNKRGRVSNGRLGQYELALGYEWNSVDSEINGVQVDIDNPLAKVLYRGEITVEPGGLPFRLHAYSNDMHQTTFTDTDLGVLFVDDDQTRDDWGIVTDIHNGTHIISGITFEAGVRNGHYEGQYRDILKTLPRFLIDYRQIVVHDVRGPIKRDYVDRDLAFVSLNKKDNWFHYRRFEHIDKILPEQSSSTDTLMLGTIDHRLRRQWINLTNWIQVSTDISTTKYTGGQGSHADERYDLNLFTKARRSRWNLDNYTTYSRVRTGERLERTLEVPFFARGELNRDTAWRFQIESLQYDDDEVGGFDRKQDNLYMNSQIEAFRQARYILRPLIEMETRSGSEGEGQAARLTLELYSNSRYRSNAEVFAGYSVLYASGTSVSGADVSYVEQDLKMRQESRFGQNFKLGAEEEVVYSTGYYNSSIGHKIYARNDNAIFAASSAGLSDDSLLKSKLRIFAEDSRPSGLRNRLEVSYDLLESQQISNRQVGVSHRLDYNKEKLFVSLVSKYVTGGGLLGQFNAADGTQTTSVPDSSSAVLIGAADFTNSFTSSLRFRYSNSRSAQFEMGLDYEGYHYDDGSTLERIAANQKYEYAFWSRSGVVRRLFVLGEKIQYLKSPETATEAKAVQTYSLYANCYPTRITLLSARLSYEFDEVADTETLLTDLSAGINFAKLQASVNYSYGHRPETATNPDILEHKWEVIVKKLF